MKCKLCSKVTTSLELHHIIPRVKGGTDDENNLIKICIECHGKVHNVDFSKRDGLISLGIEKRKIKNKEDYDWVHNNEDKVQEKFESYLDEDYELGSFLTYLLFYNFLTHTNIKELVLFNETKLNIKMKFKI